MMRAGASGAFRQRAIVLPAGRPAKKGRHLARKRPCSDRGRQRVKEGEPRLAPASLSILLPRATRSCGSGDRIGQRCAAARLCATPQKAAACTPLRTRRKAWCACTAAHDMSSPRAAPPPNHRNNPLTECFLCSSQTLAAARPTFAAGRRPLRRRPARPVAGVAARVPPARRDGGAPRAVRRPARRGRRRGCAGARADAPPAAVHNHLRGRPERQDARRARRSRQRHGRTPPPAKPGLRHAAWSRARLTTCVSARTNSCWSCWPGSASPATTNTLPTSSTTTSSMSTT